MKKNQEAGISRRDFLGLGVLGALLSSVTPNNLSSGESLGRHENIGPPKLSNKEVIDIIGLPSCTVLNFGPIEGKDKVFLDNTIRDLNKLDNPYEEFLFHYGPGAGKRRLLVGSLSGAIIAPNGKVLTLGHGIRHKSNVIYVAWSPGADYPRKLFPADITSVEWVVGDSEHAKDVALLQIIRYDENNEEMVFPCVRWGDSERVEMGDIVHIISSPRGLPFSYDMGHVASCRRSRKILQGALGHGFPGEYGIQVSGAFALQGSSGGIAANGQGEFIGLVLEFLWEKSIEFFGDDSDNGSSEEELIPRGRGHIFHTGNTLLIPSNFLKKWVSEVEISYK